MVVIDVQLGALLSPPGLLGNSQRDKEMPGNTHSINIESTKIYCPLSSYFLTPLSIVSRTSVDASCTYVLALADEKPLMAEDSERDDRRD